ncbi:hypothetical protein EV426DRAFT_711766 [Tirmania nivea]|nr:hypothetical protein EV426DRAFT_711766 [Tirmania nivea]
MSPMYLPSDQLQAPGQHVHVRAAGLHYYNRTRAFTAFRRLTLPTLLPIAPACEVKIALYHIPRSDYHQWLQHYPALRSETGSLHRHCRHRPWVGKRHGRKQQRPNQPHRHQNTALTSTCGWPEGMERPEREGKSYRIERGWRLVAGVEGTPRTEITAREEDHTRRKGQKREEGGTPKKSGDAPQGLKAQVRRDTAGTGERWQMEGATDRQHKCIRRAKGYHDEGNQNGIRWEIPAGENWRLKED